MKFEKIEALFTDDEQLKARIKPNVGKAMRLTVSILGITLLAILVPSAYLIVSDYPEAFLFLAGFSIIIFICVFLYFLEVKKTEYVITDKFLYVPAPHWYLIVCPIGEINIINEQKIYRKKRKITTLVLECSNRNVVSIGILGWLQSGIVDFRTVTTQELIRYGKIYLKAIENPESVILLLKKHRNATVDSNFK